LFNIGLVNKKIIKHKVEQKINARLDKEIDIIISKYTDSDFVKQLVQEELLNNLIDADLSVINSK
jgi:hypothetical protein